MPKPHCDNKNCTWTTTISETVVSMVLPGTANVLPIGTKVKTTIDTAGCHDSRDGKMKPHKFFDVVEDKPEKTSA